MYPWLDPATQNPVPKDMLEQNALCYLMMTGNIPPPFPAVMDYSGTFVDGSSSYGGALVMNSAQFWNQWLMPLVQFLNKASEIQCNPPVAQAYGDGSVSVAPRYTMSFNPNHTESEDNYFQFKPAADGRGWTWTGDKSTSENSDTAGGSSGWWNKISVWEECKSSRLAPAAAPPSADLDKAQASSRITFVAGGQMISITGTNSFNFSCKQTGVTSGPFKTEST